MKETENKMTLKKSVFSGLVWSFGERIIAQMVSFIVSIVLARFLLPREYGIIAMVLVFINIANVFTNGGFGEALVQKKDSDFIDFSTVFYCTLMVSMIVYIILFFTAPFIEEHKEKLARRFPKSAASYAKGFQIKNGKLPTNDEMVIYSTLISGCEDAYNGINVEVLQKFKKYKSVEDLINSNTEKK